ncbi:LysR family transcriptional regulator [Halotalea alkalilenta]|uniref:LysR family transcriptional regulator n=1 Tax=Halotalea alkalilenta TaxID=376489 RepID=UPI000489C2B3|nr:LysR family transcriptional regulator [Halotalea alkalilenta]
MDTQSLIAFLAVAETGSFSLAAERLHLTQPAVSKRIAVLEELLGQRLFDRIQRRVTLTDGGQRLLPRARQIITMVEETRRELSDIDGEVGGRLSLATSHHVGLHRLPPLLKAFTQRHPNVHMELRFLDSEQAYQGVLDGSLELAVVTLAPSPHQSLLVQPVWIDRLRYVCGPEHPLLTAPGLDLSMLADFDAVLPGEQTFTRTIVTEHFARQGLKVRIAMSTNYLETLKMMVSIGLGWSVLPETMIDEGMRPLPLVHPPLLRPLGYLHHRGRTLSGAARRMIALLEHERAANGSTAHGTSVH